MTLNVKSKDVKAKVKVNEILSLNEPGSAIGAAELCSCSWASSRI